MPTFVTRDGCLLHYHWHQHSISSPTVVFLNGTMQTAVNWKPFLPDLEAEFNVLLYDARGQGQSQLGKEKLSPQCHSKDLLEIIDFLNIPRTFLVGISHGAYLSLHFLHLYPDRIAGLLLLGIDADSMSKRKKVIDSWLSILKTEGLESMVRSFLTLAFAETFLKAHRSQIPSYLKAMVKRNDHKKIIAWLEAMKSYPPVENLKSKSGVPSLVISTGQDKLIDKESAAKLAGYCGGKHKHFENLGHSLPAENPDLFRKLLRAVVLEKALSGEFLFIDRGAFVSLGKSDCHKTNAAARVGDGELDLLGEAEGGDVTEKAQLRFFPFVVFEKGNSCCDDNGQEEH